MMPRQLARIGALALALAGVAQVGCAHKRQVFYPSADPNAGQGVRVRAPFVDVQVPTGPRRVDHDDLD